MTDQLDSDFREEEKPRPGFLTTLCVLTFIWTGLSIIGSLFSLIKGRQSEEQLLTAKIQLTEAMSQMKKMNMDGLADFYEKLILMSENVNANFYLSLCTSLIVVGIGLFGALKMFKGVKIGFHLYIIYSLLSIASVYVYINPANVPTVMIVVNTIIAAIFVFMYSRNLHWMNK